MFANQRDGLISRLSEGSKPKNAHLEEPILCRRGIEFHFICRNGIAQEVSAVPSSSSGETISLSCTIYKGSKGGDVCCAVYTVHRANGLPLPPY
jgi:hypothetical protein